MGSKKPYLGSIIAQTILAGMSLLTKVAFASGMNVYVFIFYRQAIGAVLFLPLLIIFKRREMTFPSLMDILKIFMSSLIGMTIGFNAYGVAVKFTSANLGAAAFNSLPVTTFLFSLLFRMEKLKLGTVPGIAKVVGLLVCIGGVIILTIYKGPYLKPLINHQLFEYQKTQGHHHASSGKRWIIGCLFLFITSISWGLWFVLQGICLKRIPSPLVFSGYQTILSTFQTFVLAIAMERNPSEWKLGFNMKLFALLYCGIFVVVVSSYLQSWVIKEKGPVFFAMMTPLNLLVTIIGSQLLLSDGIYLGSLIGSILLVLSLYTVLWGKSKELRILNKPSDEEAVQEPTVSSAVQQTVPEA